MATTKTPAAEQEKTVRIRLPKYPGKTADLFVGVNERTWLIKRGEEVDVPECVADIIRISEEADMNALEAREAMQK